MKLSLRCVRVQSAVRLVAEDVKACRSELHLLCEATQPLNFKLVANLQLAKSVPLLSASSHKIYYEVARWATQTIGAFLLTLTGLVIGCSAAALVEACF